MNERVFTILITETECNQVLDALSSQPYRQVAGLVHKLIAQAQAQINPPIQPTKPDEVPADGDANQKTD